MAWVRRRSGFDRVTHSCAAGPTRGSYAVADVGFPPGRPSLDECLVGAASCQISWTDIGEGRRCRTRVECSLVATPSRPCWCSPAAPMARAWRRDHGRRRGVQRARNGPYAVRGPRPLEQAGLVVPLPADDRRRRIGSRRRHRRAGRATAGDGAFVRVGGLVCVSRIEAVHDPLSLADRPGVAAPTPSAGASVMPTSCAGVLADRGRAGRAAEPGRRRRGRVADRGLVAAATRSHPAAAVPGPPESAVRSDHGAAVPTVPPTGSSTTPPAGRPAGPLPASHAGGWSGPGPAGVRRGHRPASCGRRSARGWAPSSRSARSTRPAEPGEFRQRLPLRLRPRARLPGQRAGRQGDGDGQPGPTPNPQLVRSWRSGASARTWVA